VFLLLWVCGQIDTLIGRARLLSSTAFVGVGAVVAILVPLVRVPALHELSANAAEVEALAPCLPMHATLMQMSLDAAGAVSPRLHPMAEQSGLLTVPRQALDVANESGWFRFYLWRYTDRVRVDRDVLPGRSFDDVPTPIDLAAIVDEDVPLTGVVVYGRSAAPPSVLGDSTVVDLDRALARHFHLVRRSPNAELWLREGVSASC
jgi:hypothetical protein